MNILALDLSLTHTGWARSDKCGSIRCNLTDVARVDHIAQRIADLAHGADLVVLEGPSFGSIGRGMADRMGLRMVVLLSLMNSSTPYVEVAPSSLKKYATGKGNAPKDSVIGCAIRQLGFPGCDNNEADAWVLLQMAHAHYAGETLPAYRSATLAAIQWPEV